MSEKYHNYLFLESIDYSTLQYQEDLPQWIIESFPLMYIGYSFVQFTHNLPITSPYRRPFIQISTKLLTTHMAAEIFKVDVRTVQRAHIETNSDILLIKYHYDVKKEYIKEDQLNDSLEFIDSIIPMISGRSYRIQSISDKFLYSMYVSR